MLLARFAKPGDPDLDMDVHDTVVVALVRCANDVLIDCAGGHTIGAGGPEAVSAVRFTLAYPDSDISGHLLDTICARLEAWRDRRTRLRVCTAPGRIATMSEHERSWVGVPHRSAPASVER